MAKEKEEEVVVVVVVVVVMVIVITIAIASCNCKLPIEPFEPCSFSAWTFGPGMSEKSSSCAVVGALGTRMISARVGGEYATI